jgi:putative transposase
VEIDEFKIDLIALCIALRRRNFFTDEEWAALGLDKDKKRWWLSIAIDCASRCVLAARLSRKPTTEGALATLEMAMMDKSAWSDAAGTRSRWTQHGSFETLVTDCGGPYLTDAFEAAAQDLGITVLRTVAGKPDQRGRIERFFRTVALKLLPQLPGRTFSNVVERDDHPSEERAALTIDDLTKVLIRWIVDAYHNTPHAGLGGQTPLDAWDELVERWGVLPPPDLRARRLAFGRRLARKVQRTGIQVLGVTYSSEALQRWRLHSRKHEVAVRWHPGDLGAIEVKFDGAWREVPAVIDGFHGRTAQEWVAATRQIRASNQNRARVREDIVLQAFGDIDAIAGAAASRADILVHDWSSDRISGLEDRLFIGFEIAPTPAVEAPEPIGPKALLGTVIPVGGDAADEVSAPEDELPKAASSADADIEEDFDDEDPDDWGIE